MVDHRWEGRSPDPTSPPPREDSPGLGRFEDLREAARSVGMGMARPRADRHPCLDVTRSWCSFSLFRS